MNQSTSPPAPLDPKKLYVWEHELIHMIDHLNIIDVSHSFKYDGVKLLVKYFMDYRFEGIADLYYLLKGNSDYRSIDEARTEFLGRALTIDNRDFIEGLIKPGPDGKVFVEHEELEDLAGYVQRCVMDINRVWIRTSKLTQNPAIIELFRLMRMEK